MSNSIIFKFALLFFLLFLASCDDQEGSEIILARDDNRRALNDAKDPEQYLPRCSEMPLEQTEFPDVICVMPAYPNPYDNFSNLEIIAKRPVSMKVELYSGDRLIAVTFDGIASQGPNIFEIPSFDENGQDLRSGVYKLKYSVKDENSENQEFSEFSGYGYLQIAN